MKLVPDWQQAWKWLSVQLATVGVALQTAIIAFPGVRDWMSDRFAHWAGLIILLSAVLGRLVDQGKQGGG